MKSAPQKISNHHENVNQFEHLEFDVTNCMDTICCLLFICPPYKKTLVLEPEFAVFEEISVCGTNRRRVAYGELSADLKTDCICCISVNGMSPGSGCETEKVHKIAEELQKRIGARGDTGIIQKSEQTMQNLLKLQKDVIIMDAKIDLIMKSLNIRYDESSL